jgi:hypothetical protein
MKFVALITDFGLSGWYAGELKGSIISLYSDVQFIDITHLTTPGDIRSAAFTLAACLPAFPEQTVFCVVVDPGVRSSRRAIAAYVDNKYLLGPDNGVLSWALRNEPSPQVRSIDTAEVFRDAPRPPPHTDIFGPAAAYIASGKRFAAIGPAISDFMVLPFPKTSVASNAITSEVIDIDHFGNIVIAADNHHLHNRSGSIGLTIGGIDTSASIVKSYDLVPTGSALVYSGSCGYIEIGINSGNAAEYFSVQCGSAVRLLFR